MGPIEPCVVGEEIDEQAERQIPERLGVNAGIDARPAVRLPPPGADTRRKLVYRGAREGAAALALYLLLQPAIEAGGIHVRRKGAGPTGVEVAQATDRGNSQARQRDRPAR